MRVARQLSATILLLAALAVAALASPAVAARVESSPAAAPMQPPETLDSVLGHALQLREDGRHAEAANVLQKFLARNPNAAEAHLLLGATRRDLAATMTEPERARQFDLAATHFKQALDLTTTESPIRPALLWSLVRSYLDGNRLADAETYARQLVREDPTAVDVYAQLSSILGKADRADEATAVLLQARTAVPRDLEPQRRLGLYMWQLVQASPRLSHRHTRMLLDEALAIADEALASTPDDDALRFKAAVLLVQADRVEQDGNRRRALKAEGDRLFERSLESSRGGRSEINAAARRPQNVPTCRAPMSFVSDSKPLADEAAIYEKVLAKSPDCVQAHLALARAQRGLADQIKDRDPKSIARRTGHLEVAATHLQRALDLGPGEEARRSAPLALIDVFGPGNLNRPIEAESLARAEIKRNPADPTFHYLLLRILLGAGRSQEADGVLRAARQAIPSTAEARHQIGAELWDIVYHDPTLSRVDAQKLLVEAVARLDEALTIKPDYREALVYKKLVLELQATRVEQDAAKVKALRAEIERLDKVVKDVMARSQP